MNEGQKPFKEQLCCLRWGAHRGDESHYEENTIPAFESAIQKGARCIECDLRLDGAGRVVVFHNETVAGVPVWELQDWEVLLFSELLDRIPAEITLALELKGVSANSDVYREEFLEKLSRYREKICCRPHFFLSFSPDILEGVQKVFSGSRTVLLIGYSEVKYKSNEEKRVYLSQELEMGRRLGVSGYCLNKKLFPLLEENENFPMLAYTFRSEEEIEREYDPERMDLIFLSDPGLADKMGGGFR